VCLDRGIRPEKLRVIPNGVDPALGDVTPDPAFRPQLEARLGLCLSQRRILVNVGRAVQRKGLSWFVREVMPRLPRDVVLLLVGPRFPELKWLFRGLARQPFGLPAQATRVLGLPVDEPDILEAIRQTGLQERVLELGRLSYAEILQVLLLADLFVMPNVPVGGDVEGFGLVVLEAAACGLPVLASGIEGLTDAVTHGRNGWLVEPLDARAWSEQIRLALGDRSALRRFGRASRAYTRAHCSWSRMVDRYLELFEQLSRFSAGSGLRPSKAWQPAR
jgi:phosphatidylinositol alpha-1,6-mannosyltransferase